MGETQCGSCQHYSTAPVECWQYPGRGVCTHWSKHIKGVLRMRQDKPLQEKCFHAKPEDLRNMRLF